MKLTLVILSLVFSVSAFSQADVVLGNGHIAYYGENFYTTVLPNKKVTPSELYFILNSKHASKKDSYDTVSAQCGANCYAHESVGYTNARLIMFGETFKETDADGMFVTDVYCGKKFHFSSLAQVSNMHTEVNIEHSWPQSKFSTRYDKNQQKSDMHHLFLTDSDANNRRANHEFADTEGKVDELNVENCEISQLARMGGEMKFTPPKKHQGNVARALFYFSVRYQMPLGKNQEETMRAWHKADPIDAAEKARHEKIVKHQKVRNPFIDYPELADKILDF